MLSRQAILAYCAACSLACLSLLCSWHYMRVPWLENEHGQTIWLWKFVTKSSSVEFPGRQVCRAHQGFCAAWRTATFMLTLSLVPETLVILAIGFSWAFHHRKKTVLVVRYLLVSAIFLETAGLAAWRGAYSHLRQYLLRGKWKLIGGWQFVLLSLALNVSLLIIIVPFRSIVRKVRNDEEDEYLDEDQYSSDDEMNDSDDAVSVPDTIPPEQVDYYIFTKQARRRQLAQMGG